MIYTLSALWVLVAVLLADSLRKHNPGKYTPKGAFLLALFWPLAAAFLVVALPIAFVVFTVKGAKAKRQD